MEDLLPEDLEVADVLLNISSSSPRSGPLPTVSNEEGDNTSCGSSSSRNCGRRRSIDEDAVDSKRQKTSWVNIDDNFLPLVVVAESASRASSVSSAKSGISISTSSSTSADSE